jgi:hypothetical protein
LPEPKSTKLNRDRSVGIAVIICLKAPGVVGRYRIAWGAEGEGTARTRCDSIPAVSTPCSRSNLAACRLARNAVRPKCWSGDARLCATSLKCFAVPSRFHTVILKTARRDHADGTQAPPHPAANPKLASGPPQQQKQIFADHRVCRGDYCGRTEAKVGAVGTCSAPSRPIGGEVDNVLECS